MGGTVSGLEAKSFWVLNNDIVEKETVGAIEYKPPNGVEPLDDNDIIGKLKNVDYSNISRTRTLTIPISLYWTLASYQFPSWKPEKYNENVILVSMCCKLAKVIEKIKGIDGMLFFDPFIYDYEKEITNSIGEDEFKYSEALVKSMQTSMPNVRFASFYKEASKEDDLAGFLVCYRLWIPSSDRVTFNWKNEKDSLCFDLSFDIITPKKDLKIKIVEYNGPFDNIDKLDGTFFHIQYPFKDISIPKPTKLEAFRLGVFNEKNVLIGRSKSFIVS